MMAVLNSASYRKLLQSATIRWQMLLPSSGSTMCAIFLEGRYLIFAWAYKIGTSLHRGNVDSTDNV